MKAFVCITLAVLLGLVLRALEVPSTVTTITVGVAAGVMGYVWGDAP